LWISKIFVNGFGLNGYCILSVLDFEFVGFDCVRFEFEWAFKFKSKPLNPNTPVGRKPTSQTNPSPAALPPFFSSPRTRTSPTSPAQPTIAMLLGAASSFARGS
jgi:hypothetical protein